MTDRPLLPVDLRSGECPDPIVPPPAVPAAALLLLSSNDWAAQRSVLAAEAADADEDGRVSFNTLLRFIYGELDELHGDSTFAEEQLSMAGYLADPDDWTAHRDSWRTAKGRVLYDAAVDSTRRRPEA